MPAILESGADEIEDLLLPGGRAQIAAPERLEQPDQHFGEDVGVAGHPCDRAAWRPRESSASLPHATWNFPPFKPKKLDSVSRSPELSLTPTTFGQRVIDRLGAGATDVVAGACGQVVEVHRQIGRNRGDLAEVSTSACSVSAK